MWDHHPKEVNFKVTGEGMAINECMAMFLFMYDCADRHVVLPQPINIVELWPFTFSYRTKLHAPIPYCLWCMPYAMKSSARCVLLFFLCFIFLAGQGTNFFAVSMENNGDRSPRRQLACCQCCGIEAAPTQRIKSCMRCFTVGYCSKQCQRADWKIHKSICSVRTLSCTDSVRLEVQRSDTGEWENAGSINLIEDTTTAKLDGTASTNGTIRDMPTRTRQIIGNESSSYTYRHSHDGIDENLLIFFHGAGDTHLPFDALGRKMALPQTATLSISASISLSNLISESTNNKFIELPFGLGYTWFEEMDYECTGETLDSNHPRRLKSLTTALEILYPLLCSLTDQGITDFTWLPERVFLFGFSAGGCLAMELCRMWMEKGRIPMGGVICIAGGVKTKGLGNSTQQTQQPTDVLVITGEDDSVFSPADAQLSKRLYNASKVQIHVQKGKGHGMVDRKEEMQAIMEFLSKRLARRFVSMESL